LIDHPVADKIEDQQHNATSTNYEDHATSKSFCLNKKHYTFHELEEITNDFKEPIGEGGFGKVYKGRLIDGTIVAVKMISKISTQASKQFKREVMLFSFCTLENNKF
jgi:serine/threonine protein kinase